MEQAKPVHKSGDKAQVLICGFPRFEATRPRQKFSSYRVFHSFSFAELFGLIPYLGKGECSRLPCCCMLLLVAAVAACCIYTIQKHPNTLIYFDHIWIISNLVTNVANLVRLEIPARLALMQSRYVVNLICRRRPAESWAMSSIMAYHGISSSIW